ncbi:Maltoporin (phage lambda and maltose receptor) [Raoultella terrigena]|uniref:Maltoporin (Phage lambda and maltose receptor) n=1 Tax=Raoultella terrigena TaxID=577 RepID=A0A4U9D610_RAOTE|nr:Maltoporin (phage lambda and maltose receptor) [Raoultella terrigena]
MSDCASADPQYDFALHGYIRSGILANSDGNRADSVGLMPDGNGASQRRGHQDRADPHRNAESLTPAAGARIQANITHQSKCTSDWNCQDDDGHDVQFREGFAELFESRFRAGDDLLGR